MTNAPTTVEEKRDTTEVDEREEQEDDSVWDLVVPVRRRTTTTTVMADPVQTQTTDATASSSRVVPDAAAAPPAAAPPVAAEPADNDDDVTATAPKEDDDKKKEDDKAPPAPKRRCAVSQDAALENMAEPVLDAATAADVRARLLQANNNNKKTPAGLQIVRRILDAFGRTAIDLVYQTAAGDNLGAFKATALEGEAAGSGVGVGIECLGCKTVVRASLDEMEAHVKGGSASKHAVKFLKVRLTDNGSAALAEVAPGAGGDNNNASVANRKRKPTNAASADPKPTTIVKTAGTDDTLKVLAEHAKLLRDARLAQDIPDVLDAAYEADGRAEDDRMRRLFARDYAAFREEDGLREAFRRIFHRDQEAVTAVHTADVGVDVRDDDARVLEHDVAFTVPETVVRLRRACRSIARDVLVTVPSEAMRAAAASSAAADVPAEIYDVAAAAVEAAVPLFRKHRDWDAYLQRLGDFARDKEGEQEHEPPAPEEGDDLIKPERFEDARRWIRDRTEIAREVVRQTLRAIDLVRKGCRTIDLEACALCAKEATPEDLADMKGIVDGAQISMDSKKRRKTM